MVVIPSSVSLLAAALLALAAATAHAVKTPVYLIRHGEKPADGGSEYEQTALLFRDGLLLLKDAG